MQCAGKYATDMENGIDRLPRTVDGFVDECLTWVFNQGDPLTMVAFHSEEEKALMHVNWFPTAAY